MLKELKEEYKSTFVKLLNEGNYKIEITDENYSFDDYLKVILHIDGEEVECSVNKKGWVCWHSYRDLLSDLPKYIIKSIVAEVDNTFKQVESDRLIAEKKKIEQRLKELEVA